MILITDIASSINEPDEVLNGVISQYLIDRKPIQNIEGLHPSRIPAQEPDETVDEWRLNNFAQLRKWAYPQVVELNDAEVKISSDDPKLIAKGRIEKQQYNDKCLAVKARFPKTELLEDSLEIRVIAAKELRDILEISDIEWPENSGVMWQVRDKDRIRIQETIDAAAMLGAPPETTVNWILADNTERPTTASDLKQVLLAYTLRMQSIFVAYCAWRSGDMNSYFTLG